MRFKALIIIVLFLSSINAWDWDVHRFWANELCDYLDCGVCREHMINGSIAPDKDFKDFINHHCYDLSWDCPEGYDWDCPTKNDCPALEKADEWLLKSRSDSGCLKYYDIGVASHYFSDSKVFWHKVQREDYDRCHRPFESQVGDRINEDFEVSVCGISVTKQDMNLWLEEFKVMLYRPPKEPNSTSIEDFFFKQNGRYVIGLIVILFSLALLSRKKKRRKRRKR